MQVSGCANPTTLTNIPRSNMQLLALRLPISPQEHDSGEEKDSNLQMLVKTIFLLDSLLPFQSYFPDCSCLYPAYFVNSYQQYCCPYLASTFETTSKLSFRLHNPLSSAQLTLAFNNFATRTFALSEKRWSPSAPATSLLPHNF